MKQSGSYDDVEGTAAISASVPASVPSLSLNPFSEGNHTQIPQEPVPTLSIDPFSENNQTQPQTAVLSDEIKFLNDREQSAKHDGPPLLLRAEEEGRSGSTTNIPKSVQEEDVVKMVPTLKISHEWKGWIPEQEPQEGTLQNGGVQCEAPAMENGAADASVPIPNFPASTGNKTNGIGGREFQAKHGFIFTSVPTELMHSQPNATFVGRRAQVHFAHWGGEGIGPRQNITILTGKDATDFITMFKCGSLPEDMTVEVRTIPDSENKFALISTSTKELYCSRWSMSCQDFRLIHQTMATTSSTK